MQNPLVRQQQGSVEAARSHMDSAEEEPGNMEHCFNDISPIYV